MKIDIDEQESLYYNNNWREIINEEVQTICQTKEKKIKLTKKQKVALEIAFKKKIQEELVFWQMEAQNYNIELILNPSAYYIKKRIE
jgi:hypothetical protein